MREITTNVKELLTAQLELLQEPPHQNHQLQPQMENQHHALRLKIRKLFAIIQIGPTTDKVLYFKKKFLIYLHYVNLGNGKYLVEDIDVPLCTHLIYSFVILDPWTYEIKVHDQQLDINLGNINKFIGLRGTNPNVKLLVALGGWNDSRSNKYSLLLADPTKRAAFVKQTVQFLNQYGFDGLDLDYEYPGYDGVQTDKDGFTALVQELREAFNQEGKGWELTAAVSVSKTVIDNGYDVPELSASLDAIHLMSYDMHGSWENFVDHHGKLYGDDGDDLTVDQG